MLKKILLDTITIIFILLLTYTAVSKLFDYNQFRSQIDQSPVSKIIPSQLTWIIPIVELAVASMLVVKEWRVRGLYATLILMILFTSYLVYMNTYTYYIPCSCGGFLERLPYGIHITINVLLILILILGLSITRRQFQVKD